MPNPRLRHILLVDSPDQITYTSTSAGGASPNIPERDRAGHSSYLKSKLETAWQESENEYVAYHTNRNGVYLEFKSDPDFELILKSLEDMRSGKIRLLNVRTDALGTTTYATVYVSNDKRDHFFNKINAYAEQIDNRSGKPKNYNLINSIANIQKALLIHSFWQDDIDLIPDAKPVWCEVWLRCDSDLNANSILIDFEEILHENNIATSEGHIHFPERIVKNVFVNKENLELLSRASDYIAEYRRTKENATFWTDLENYEQSLWSQDLLDRLSTNFDNNTAVCILDGGVNHGHPLLAPVLDASDCLSLDSSWGVHDHSGHGTLMAGIASYGSLIECLSGSGQITLNHQLESVKILPNSGANNEDLWGYITSEGVSLAEINAPERNRIFCMAITANGHTRDQGRPSSWSGAIDQIAFGDENGSRLIILSAGNINNHSTSTYPSDVLTDSIHDPAQSWNAISVGAYTSLTNIKDPTLAGYTPVAPFGGISPYTTTSMIWENKWPLKPDIVMEGGNTAIDSSGFAVECEDLSCLTTYYKPHENHFSAFNMTSLACSKASWFAAQIQLTYPDFWPETARGLMIHSANWPQSIIDQFHIDMKNKKDILNLMRICGYGVPSLEQALYSASNTLTLIAQESIQPFFIDDKKPKTRDMHLYDLPWPTEVLESLPPDTHVHMRITLSYFIEPGPGEVGWKDRYRYPSHMLRFDVKSPSESKDEFTRRINKAVRDEDEGHPGTESVSSHWLIGSHNRNKGSIHSDIWQGTAAELASSNIIAVYPGIGWWRERKHLGKVENQTRYALIVTIHTPDETVDIYTPVAIRVEIPTLIQT